MHVDGGREAANECSLGHWVGRMGLERLEKFGPVGTTDNNPAFLTPGYACEMKTGVPWGRLNQRHGTTHPWHRFRRRRSIFRRKNYGLS